MSSKKIALAALCLMVVIGALALLRPTINPDHSSDALAAQAAGSAQPELDSAKLDSMANQVEEARQDAISAGISLGDGAGPYIDNYRARLHEFEQAKARLNASHAIVTNAH